MRIHTLVLLLTSTCLDGSVLSAAPTSAASKTTSKPAVHPSISLSAVLRPQFYVPQSKTPRPAGTAFVALHPKTQKPVLVTALHLLGPAGGFAKNIPVHAVDKQVREVKAVAFEDNKVKVTAKTCATKSGSPLDPEGDQSARNDVVAWHVTALNPQVKPLKLAPRDARAGQQVWIVGDTLASSNARPRLFAARVQGLQFDGLLLTLQQPVALDGFSGAPVIDARGEVVGLLIGDMGEVLVCPGSEIRDHLTEQAPLKYPINQAQLREIKRQLPQLKPGMDVQDALKRLRLSDRAETSPISEFEVDTQHHLFIELSYSFRLHIIYDIVERIKQTKLIARKQ